MFLGEIIKAYRTQHGLSMDEFATRADLSKGYVSMLEKNKHPQNSREIIPSLQTFSKVARAMKIEADELIRTVDGRQKIDIADAGAEINTIAAHHDGETWTNEELDEIERFKEYVRSKRKGDV